MDTKETVNQAMDMIYEHFKSDFIQGKLSLAGSIYWKELGLEVSRYPGDIDLLIINDDAYQLQFLQEIRRLFGGIASYHFTDKIIVNGKPKDPIISYTINLHSGVRIELMPSDLHQLAIIKFDQYEVGHSNPVKQLLNMSTLFKIYRDSMEDHVTAGNIDHLKRLFKKTKKVYTSILKYIHYFDLPMAVLQEQERFVEYMQMAYFILDAAGYPYWKIKFELDK
ncbi:MAG: hypothetical protein AAGA66_14190 [Bacteroidota bacterium]